VEDQSLPADRTRSSKHQDAQSELDRLQALEAGTPFDLEAGPMIRGRLRACDNEHALLITMHQHRLRRLSNGSMIHERAPCTVLSLRKDDPLPDLEIQLCRLRCLATAVDRGRYPAATGSLLEGCVARSPALLELPTDHPRPRQQNLPATSRSWSSKSIWRLSETAERRHGTTLFMTLLAGWAALLARLSNQQDLVIGHRQPIADEPRSSH